MNQDELIINDERCFRIDGFERYHVSESGRVYRTETGKPRTWRTKGRIYISENQVHFDTRNNSVRRGYVSLTDTEGKLHNVEVAPVVALAFGVIKEKLNKKKQAIVFKDGDIRNLHFTNLEVGERKPSNSKLSKEDVKHIKKQIKMGIPLRKIAWFFSVSEMQINRIKTGENWGTGKRKIKAPQAPFEIEDGRMRKYIATFNKKKTATKVKKPFVVKRNAQKPTDNTIVGIVDGYKLWIKHSNITRARQLVDKLNDYFFNDTKKPIKESGGIFKDLTEK